MFRKSISYYLTLCVIKIKGIKADFSKDPIDYNKLRKEDVHGPKISDSRQFFIKDSCVTEIGPSYTKNNLIIFIHGGAFIYGPTKHHWDTLKNLSAGTNSKIWMIDYPKAPENKIDVISKNIDQVYELAQTQFPKGNIVLAGDSVGGTLATALTQRLIKKNIPSPSLLILISPVMDCSFNNEKISGIEDYDPMLSRAGALSAKKMCSHDGNLENPLISPIKGNFNNFPRTLLFIAQNDITSPDQELLVTKLESEGISYKVVRGKGMPHIWPLLPVMREAKLALREIRIEINRKFD